MNLIPIMLYRTVFLPDCSDQQGNNQKLPDAIVGDLDSIHTSVRSHYENLGVTVVEDRDQYSTDFTKCLKYLKGHAGEILSPVTKPSASASAKQGASASAKQGDASRLDILILGGLGGRVDQAFSQIHHLYQMTWEYSSAQSAGSLYLVSEESLTFVLQLGRNVIHTPGVCRPRPPHDQSTLSSDRNAGGEDDLLEENVGIIPLSGPARISTKGFEWDVKHWHTQIGGQLSTSNHIRDDIVEVQTDVPVLFTVELAGRFKRVR